MTINEIAERWGLTPRRIRSMCLKGQFDVASKLGREWAIPSDASKPVDGRITTGKYINWRKV